MVDFKRPLKMNLTDCRHSVHSLIAPSVNESFDGGRRRKDESAIGGLVRNIPPFISPPFFLSAALIIRQTKSKASRRS